MSTQRKPRAIGINHVSIEVGSIGEALAFYAKLIDFEVEDADAERADIGMGDQFLAFTVGRHQSADVERHFGLVVDDKALFRQALVDNGVEPLPGQFLGFIDPWGNHIEVIGYANIKFTKSPNVLRAMGVTGLTKNQHAMEKLVKAGMA